MFIYQINKKAYISKLVQHNPTTLLSYALKINDTVPYIIYKLFSLLDNYIYYINSKI